MKKGKNKKTEENEITLDFNVTQKGKNSGAYSILDKRSKKYKKKDVKINAIKRKNKHPLVILLICAVLITGICIATKKLNKKEEVPYVPPVIEEKEPEIDIYIEEDTDIEDEIIAPVEETLDLNSKEVSKLSELIKGITIDEQYSDISSIKNSNKIKMVINKAGLEDGFYNLANEKVQGVKIEKFNEIAKEIFGEIVQIEHATTREFEYNPKEQSYTKIPSQHLGYIELEYITNCKKLENIYTVDIAYAQGYLTDHTYVISGNIEEIEVNVSTTSINDTSELVKEIKPYEEKLEKYQYTIKENIDGTFSIISFMKI